MRLSEVTVHTPLSREVFWHKNAKIPRHTARIYAISILCIAKRVTENGVNSNCRRNLAVFLFQKTLRLSKKMVR